jgi:hypothetical protein
VSQPVTEGFEHAGHDRAGPHVPGGASPHRHPRQCAVRRPGADRRHQPHQAEP